MWDLPRGRPVTTLDLPGGSVLATALGTGTLYVARSTPTGDVRDEVWDLARGRRTLTVDGVGASHLAVRPDGRLLAGDGKAARLPSGPAAPRDLVQGDEVGALAFTADGSLLAAGDQSGRVTLWDRDLRHREGILRDVLTASEGVSALAFSPDGRTLAVAGDAGSLQLWGVATQQPLGGPLTTPGEEIDSLAFAADGTTVYASSAHVPLQRYTVDTARALARVCARAGGTGLTPSYNRSGSTTTTYTWQITMKPGQFAAPIQVVERRWTQGAYQGVYHSTGKPCLPSPGDINAKPHFYTWSPNERWGRWTSNIAVQDYGTYHVWS
ncbi:PD40 domain-containing protein [Streptomyces roseirectus]|uniref:PD40 domain-containing protein n=1 Tax=Streptomyces roseirectus TaxID=2768066 RepID=A0A7H0I786_9ACTN|nr:PD40 domain-containing protein [Streptomyces roseirectus]QNP68652.1 PD40 domain-containing protein [Streptomyces roseirectus]